MTISVTTPLQNQTVRYISRQQPRLFQGYAGVQQDTVDFKHVGKVKSDNVRFGARPLYEGPFENITIITDFGDGNDEGLSNARIESRFYKVLDFVIQNRSWSPEIKKPEDVKEPKYIKPSSVAGAWFLNGQKAEYARQQKEAAKRKLLGFDIAPWTYRKTHDGKYVSKEYEGGTLEKTSISSLPGGNRDYAARALLELGFEDPSNKKIIVHVIDPGVGVNGTDHDRSILVTENNGIYIGPNNGSLGLVVKRLRAKGEEPKLLQIDLNKVQELERIRLNDPNYRIATTFHGRDAFAVVAGAIAGGLDPEALAVKDESGKVKLLQPVFLPFSQPSKLPTQSGEVTKILALEDKTFANLKLNVPQDADSFNKLVGQTFEIYNPVKERWVPVTVQHKFSDVKENESVLLLGSSTASEPGKSYLELAVNLGRAAREYGIGRDKAQELLIRKP